jgi:hypothetical protein
MRMRKGKHIAPAGPRGDSETSTQIGGAYSSEVGGEHPHYSECSPTRTMLVTG